VIETALSFDNVSMAYPGSSRQRIRGEDRAWALRGVSFVLKRGSVLGVLGPNGAGKTTLLRLAAGLLLPVSGEVCVFGSPQRPLGCNANQVGIALSDDRSFSWRLSVLQNLRLFGALGGLAHSEVNRKIGVLIESLGLRAFVNSPVGELSTGFRQRLAICRALLASPCLLLLDEPTKGLDSPTALAFRRFLRSELKEQKQMTIVLVSHDIEEVKSVCDSALVLVNGRIGHFGNPARLEEILTNSVTVEIREKQASNEGNLECLIGGKGIAWNRAHDSTLIRIDDARDAKVLARVFVMLDRPDLEIQSLSAQRMIAWPTTGLEAKGNIDQRHLHFQSANTPHKTGKLSFGRARLFVGRCVALARSEIQEMLSYKFARILSVAMASILIATVVFGSRCLKIGEMEIAAGHRASYLAFLITGFIGSSATLGVMRGIPQRVRKHQVQGTLEALLASGCSMVCLAAAFCGLELLSALVGTWVFVLIASFMGAHLPLAGISASFIVLIIGLPSFFGIALISTAFCLTKKKGDPIAAFLSLGFLLTAGVVFPLASAPAFLRSVANELPLSLVVEGVRRTTLAGDRVTDLAHLLLPLLLYDMAFLVLGFLAIRRGISKATSEGTLVQY
jgi:ABC-type multidrug transport system ATPase subunit/ABC-type multidrug transport system permease subunit